MSFPRLFVVATASSLALLTGCVVAPVREPRVVYAAQPVARPVPVMAEYGRVDNIGTIQIAQRPSGGGAILGAVIGCRSRHRSPRRGWPRRDDEVYRVHVRFDNGVARDFDFQRIDDLRIGDRVKFDGGQLHRL
jgi:outer membrane lipoprotein SlyB